MYFTYSINPTTLNIAVRTIHDRYSDAVKSMQEQARDFITLYKSHHKTVYITNESEIQKYTDATYFMKLDDEGKKITILEKREVIQRGYIYNKTKYEAVPILVFSILDVEQLNPYQRNSTIIDNNVFLNKIQQQQPTVNNAKSVIINHNYMDELKSKLNKRRPKCD